MSQNKLWFNGQCIDQDLMAKLFADAKSEIYDEILLELEGLQSVASRLDDKNAFRVNRYIDRIKQRLQ